MHLSKILLSYIVFWSGFLLAGCFHVFDWWGKDYLSYIILIPASWVGWMANVMWLGWCEENLAGSRAGLASWSVILINILLVFLLGDKFDLIES